MKKLLKALIGAALLLIAAHIPVSAADVYTLSLATWGSSKHPQVAMFTKNFMEMVVRNSHGRIKFKYFPDNQMVRQTFVPMAIPTDTVDIALTTLETWAGRNQDVTITMTPLWTVSQTTTCEELVPGRPLFDYFNASLQKSNTRLLALFDIGPPVISTTFPLARPEDMKGRMIRVPSRASAEIMRALGASPAVMSVGDVYAALKLNTVDGAVGGLQGYVGLKHYEVTQYALATNGIMGTFIHGYVMNNEKFNSLPPDLQQVLQDAATAARNEVAAKLTKTYPDYLKTAEKHDVKVTGLFPGTPAYMVWDAFVRELREQNRKEFNPQLVKLVEALSTKDASK